MWLSRVMLLVVVVVHVLGCGDGAAPATVDAGVLPHPWEGAYARVIPGYDDAATCQAENPDPVFHCIELLSLCARGEVNALYTDILSDGTWTQEGTSAHVVLTDNSFSQDGDFVLTMDASGAVSSPEIYGARPFAHDPETSLCPRE